jgi:hypothetical protein
LAHRVLSNGSGGRCDRCLFAHSIDGQLGCLWKSGASQGPKSPAAIISTSLSLMKFVLSASRSGRSCQISPHEASNFRSDGVNILTSPIVIPTFDSCGGRYLFRKALRFIGGEEADYQR